MFKFEVLEVYIYMYIFILVFFVDFDSLDENFDFFFFKRLVG